jgi:hypothetical protein
MRANPDRALLGASLAFAGAAVLGSVAAICDQLPGQPPGVSIPLLVPAGVLAGWGTAVAAQWPMPAAAVMAAATAQHRAPRDRDCHDQVPCIGTGETTITYNEVDHTTENANGFHATFTQTGTFSAVMDQGGTSSGRFTTWGNFNTDTTGQQANGTFIFSLTVKSGVGAGTHYNETAHFTGPVDADGNPIFSLAKVAFDRVNCHRYRRAAVAAEGETACHAARAPADTDDRRMRSGED